MQGKVTADRLNVRSRPDLKGAKIGLLTQDKIVEILGRKNNWVEIKFNGGSGFVSGDYIESLDLNKVIKGKVKVATLNVRNQPNLQGTVVGSLVSDTIVDVIAKHDDWLEIEFNDSLAFIHNDYVELMEAGQPERGRISTDVLNVRTQPNLSAEIAGNLARDTVVNLISKIGNWYEIRFNGSPAYIHGEYVETMSREEIETSKSPEVTVVSPDRKEEQKEPAEAGLVPEARLPVSGTNEQKKVARTWNQFGNWIEELSNEHQIDPGSAVAVLCVESSGKGFEKNNKDRMIIRFENHKFWTYWGKDNTESFHKYFKYGEKKNGKVQVWLGHYWRKDDKGEWQTFHGSQLKEWQVLDFSRSLDDTAALYSISMGAPQIMGFHHHRIGYATVQEMFEKFSGDIRYHIKGLFDFLDKPMINALRKRDFVAFAGYYNGTGQKEEYGKWIQNHYDAFKGLKT
jgi:uncharacterized protein YgiM (DUF1202 family)